VSRRGAVTAAVVIAALIGTAALLDDVVRSRVEASIAAELRTELGARSAEVTIAGFPFLGQVVAGSLDRIDVSAPSATMEGIRLDDVQAVLHGVSTGTPRTVEGLELRGSLDPASLGTLLPPGVTATGDGDRLRLATDLAGVSLQATVAPRAAGRAVALDLQGLTAGGVRIDPSALPFGLGDLLAGLSIPLDALPAGVELSSVTVSGGRVLVVAEGSGLVLAPATGGSAAGGVAVAAAG